MADAKAAVTRLYELHDKLEQQAIEFQEQKTDNPASLPFQKLGQDCATLWQALRDADHLTLMGEPAGVDLKNKLLMLKIETGRLAYAGLRSPKAQGLKQRIITVLKKDTQKREKFLDQQQQLIESGKLEQAEVQLEKYGLDKLEPLTVFLSPTERDPYVKRFAAVLRDCDSKLIAKRQGEYQQQAKQAMTKNLEAVALLGSEATRIRAEIAASGTAKIGDNATANAAEAIAYLTKLWGSASAGLVRNYALLWAYGGKQPSNLMAGAMQPVKQLEASAKSAISSVIEAAAAKTASDQVGSLYGQILEQLSVIDRRLGGFEISGEFEPALKKLVDKDPSLAAQIAAYERATNEALRWRKTFASQQAAALRGSYPTIDSKASQKVSVKVSNKPKMYGGSSTNERPLLTPVFGQPAAWTVFETSEFLVATRASTRPTLRISPTSRTSVVPFGKGHYANVAVGMEIQSEVDALKELLLIDPTHPPLSMAAADAISSADLREYEAVGGEIGRVHLEAVVTRFIALPGAAYPLSSLGSLPTVEDTEPLVQTCWRFDLQPQWVQHKYFTFVLPSAAK